MKPDLRATYLSPDLPMLKVRHKTPVNYEAISLEADQKEWLTRHALMIFTELANSGKPFAECMAGVFLTGLHYANQVKKDDEP